MNSSSGKNALWTMASMCQELIWLFLYISSEPCRLWIQWKQGIKLLLVPHKSDSSVPLHHCHSKTLQWKRVFRNPSLNNISLILELSRSAGMVHIHKERISSLSRFSIKVHWEKKHHTFFSVFLRHGLQQRRDQEEGSLRVILKVCLYARSLQRNRDP